MSKFTASRLRWACRRGMLELDLLFEHYLDEHYPHASPAEQALFERLLSESDQDLFDWLIHAKPTPDLCFVELIKKLRKQA
jgi:antitoxin CptB